MVVDKEFNFLKLLFNGNKLIIIDVKVVFKFIIFCLLYELIMIFYYFLKKRVSLYKWIVLFIFKIIFV